MQKLVYGVGVYEAGEHMCWDGSKNTKGYTVWHSMLERCYSKKHKGRFPTYTGCSVSDVFKNFQSFMEWATSQVGAMQEGFHFDKDLLSRGNKVYGEDVCVFIPHRLNSLLLSCKASRGEFPIGVYFSKQKSRYMAKCCVAGGITKKLGQYSTPEAAFFAYKAFKEAHIKEQAQAFKQLIDIRAYDALMKYEINITD